MLKRLSVMLLIAVFFGAFAGISFAKTEKGRGPLSKITFIHYRRAAAKPDWAGKPDKSSGAVCYDDFGKGIYWKVLPQPVVINPVNPDGLSVNEVTSAIDASFNEWNSHSLVGLYDGFSVDNTVAFNGDALDGKNALGFGDYNQNGVIAVATVWGYFGGPPQGREIVEFDIMFDTDFNWGVGGESNLMDLRNIATHEIGHGWGLKDIYDSSCGDVTMYGYSNYGEVSKQTLEPADIEGIQSLYH